MPSDSIAGFLDRAQASRVLFPEQVEQLIRQPDIPQSDLASLCSYLLSRGVLTQFQADAIREGRGHDLSFGGYPVLDRLGPCPGGTAYRALHPSLRTPLVLRRLDPVAYAPSDDVNAVVHRARTFGSITHPNLLPVLDAGVYEGQAYAVLDVPADAADIASLLKEVGGAMPGFLAAEYGWAIASGLRAIHERGGWHGEVRPGLLFVGPVTTKPNADGTLRRRPAPNATVKLTEVGLIPVRPSALAAIAAKGDWPGTDVLPFLPPERISGNVYDPRGDIYGLGASLYLLLAGRAPFSGETPEEVANKILTTEPAPLSAVRPDVQPDLAAFVMRMLAKRPEDRPQTAYDVCEGLAKFGRPGTLPTTPPPTVVPHAVPHAVPVAVPHAVPVAATPAEEPEPDAWGVNANALAEAQAASVADRTQPRRRQLTDAEKSRSKMWIALGLCLHLTATALLIGWLMGAFDSTPEPVPQTDTKEKKPDQPKKKTPPKKKKSDEDS